ncbi:PASTA domain-containing protein [Prescottella defluvii]|uniref:PASTA domain-containing protein n=1 Tax=Prescottella defluvii TaxID=1323361 RepID=UPI0004F2C216|nr:PASTA domain-containing protein [Prescottella defluvii]
MNAVTPYLRVIAGLFAGVATWLAIVSLVQLDFGSVAIFLIMAAGLWYLAIGRPIRDHFARIKAEKDALAARAQAGHEAFLAGDTSAAFAPPPEAPAKKPVRRGVVIASAFAAVFVLIGIIGDISDGLDPDSSTEDTTKTSATPVPAPAAPAPPAAPAVQAPLAQQPTSAASAGTGTAQALMPNVMCMNLQKAQDTIQEAGVYYSQSEDATGKGRMQISDRNWVVVAQNPAAGAPISEGDAMLSVVKQGEPGDCS